MWSIAKPVRARRGAGASALFARVAAAIADEIRRGALRSGDRLPSTRELAAQFDVNRNTIVAAYDELVAQGWIIARGAAGTFVAAEVPDRPVDAPTRSPPRRKLAPHTKPAPRREIAARGKPAREQAAPRGMAARAGFDAPPIIAPRGLFLPPGVRYQLSAGVPDTRLFPGAVLARAYRRALQTPAGVRGTPRARAGLDYADAAGAPRLREAIATMLRTTRAIPVTAANVLVTRGSQMAIDLVARWLARPGATIAVEELGYGPAWRAFEHAGARLAGVPVDAHGLVVDALPHPAPRLVYVTPHHQYPTTVLMAPARRLALLARARAEQFAILEDDYDHEFHFDGRPVAPLAAADPHGNVLYVGTLSKILAPGLRLGYLAAPEPVITALAHLRHATDRQGDQILEHAVAELFEDGEVARHARKTRGIYARRRDALVTALHRELRGAVTFDVPAGGITLWLRADDDLDLDAWRTRALAHGVAFTIARDLALDGRPRPFLRVAYARYDETELTDAVRRLRRALTAR
jgi:GntR family transcriptional regulator/MocR family aminotransferase